MSEDQDDTIIVPLTTLQKKITGQPWLRFVMVSAKSRSGSYAAQQQIQALLRDRHRIRPEQPDDFTVRNLADMADLASEASKVMTGLLASIAGVSLLVGGIGIMNIMLVSCVSVRAKSASAWPLGPQRAMCNASFLLRPW